MDKVKFECESCGQHYSVAQDHAGKKFACKNCGEDVTVPYTVQASEAVAAPPAPTPAAPPAPTPAAPPAPAAARPPAPPAAPVAPPPPQAPQAPQRKRATRQVAAPPAAQVQPAPPPAPAPEPSTPRTRVLRRDDVPAQPTGPQMPGQRRRGGPTIALSKGDMRARGQTDAMRRPGAAPAPAAAPAPRQGQTRNFNAPSAHPGTRSMQRPTQTMQRGGPGAYPPGVQKKSNAGVWIGVGGGALVLLLIIVGIVVATGDSGNDPNIANNPVIDQAELDRKAAEALAAELKARTDAQTEVLSNASKQLSEGTLYAELWESYKSVSALKDVVPELADKQRSLKRDMAKGLADRMDSDLTAKGADIKLHHEVAMRLQKEGFEEQASKIARTVCTSSGYQRTTWSRDKEGNQVGKDSAEFIALEAISGLAYFETPKLIREADFINGFDEYREFSEYLNDFQAEYPSGLAPKDDQLYIDLKEASDILLKRVQSIIADHEKDGFAEFAADAFNKFRNKWGVETGDKPAAFPGKFDYGYSEPFIFYLELEGREDMEPEEIIANMSRKTQILKDLVDHFYATCRDPWGLERTYPDNIDPVDRVRYPLEIVVLRDGDRYSEYQEEVMGRSLPGARAHYSPQYRQIITWDDPEAEEDLSRQWFDTCVLAHEAWHFMSSIHMPGKGVIYSSTPDPETKEPINLPRYSSLVVQEGLTDYTAGFEEYEKDGRVHFKWAKVNHLRLGSFREWTTYITERWKEISQSSTKIDQAVTWEEGRYRGVMGAREMIRCLFYGACGQMAFENLVRLGFTQVRPQPRDFAIVPNATGFYYAWSCSFSYFLMNYNNGQYADKFMQWCEEDYKDEIKKQYDYSTYYRMFRNGFKTTPGIERFMEIFEIDGLDSPMWDELDDQFYKYTMEDVEYIKVSEGYVLIDEDKKGDDLGGDSDEDGIPDFFDSFDDRTLDDEVGFGHQYALRIWRKMMRSSGLSNWRDIPMPEQISAQPLSQLVSGRRFHASLPSYALWAFGGNEPGEPLPISERLYAREIAWLRM